MPADAFSGNQRREPRMKFEFRFTAAVGHYADALQSHRIAESRAHRFGERFFRRETISDKQHGVDGLCIARPFTGCEYSPREAFAVLFEQSLDPLRFDD